MQMRQLDNRSLSTDVVDVLRTRILDGDLSAGSRLNEVHLAEELGISRTPLREALTRLSSSGLVHNIPRRGFFVAELTIEEFRQVYGIRSILDPAALRESGLPSADQLRRLEKLNRQLAGAKNSRRRIAIDNDWHLTLLEHCPNQILLDLIVQFMDRTERYEHAYLRQHRHAETAIGQHDAVHGAIRGGDLAAAVRALESNLNSGREPIELWLRSLEETQ